MKNLAFEKNLFNLYWLLEQIWDSPRTNKFFQEKRHHLVSSCRQKSFVEKSQLKPVKEVMLNEGETPFININSLNEPIVFRGFAKNAPAVKLWDFDYLKMNYGSIIQSSYKSIKNDFQLKTINDVIKNIENNKNESITFGDLFFQSEKARSEMNYESFFNEISIEKKLNNYKQLFLAGKGYFNGFHSEMVQSLTIQVTGVKRWYIIPPHESLFLNPIVSRMMYFPCGSEIRKVNQDQFFAHHFESSYVDLHPGDVFYLPPFYWHYVEYLENAISIGRFWTDLSTFIEHPLLSFMIMTSRNPSIFRQLMNRGKNSVLTYGIEKND